MRRSLPFILSLCLSFPFILSACTKEQDSYTVPPDIWHALTPEQQQLISQEAAHSQTLQAGS
jgi:hypothetical protein